jgi:hypothetical protein
VDLSVLDASLGSPPKKPATGAPGALPEEGGEVEPEAGEVAMQDYLDAQAAGDAAGAWSAFKSMVALCGGPMSEE